MREVHEGVHAAGDRIGEVLRARNRPEDYDLLVSLLSVRKYIWYIGATILGHIGEPARAYVERFIATKPEGRPLRVAQDIIRRLDTVAEENATKAT